MTTRPPPLELRGGRVVMRTRGDKPSGDGGGGGPGVDPLDRDRETLRSLSPGDPARSANTAARRRTSRGKRISDLVQRRAERREGVPDDSDVCAAHGVGELANMGVELVPEAGRPGPYSTRPKLI